VSSRVCEPCNGSPFALRLSALPVKSSHPAEQIGIAAGAGAACGDLVPPEPPPQRRCRWRSRCDRGAQSAPLPSTYPPAFARSVASAMRARFLPPMPVDMWTAGNPPLRRVRRDLPQSRSQPRPERAVLLARASSFAGRTSKIRLIFARSRSKPLHLDRAVCGHKLLGHGTEEATK